MKTESWKPFEAAHTSFRTDDPSHESQLFSLDSFDRVLTLPAVDSSSGLKDVFTFDDLGHDLTQTHFDESPSSIVCPTINPPIDSDPRLSIEEDWFIELQEASNKRQYHTWDTLTIQPLRTQLYLSEASADVVDAALSRSRYSSSRVVPHEHILHATYSLLLGRSSIFFQWSTENQSFQPTLEGMAISGLSTAISESMIHEVVKQGSLLRRMRETNSLERCCRLVTKAAFKASIMAILNTIDEKCLEAKKRSLLLIQDLSRRVNGILDVLWKIQLRSKTANTDEQVVSVVHDLQRGLSNQMDVHSSLATAIAQAVYRPWLDQLVKSVTVGEAGEVSALEEESEVTRSLLRHSDRLLLSRARANLQFLKRYAPAHAITSLMSGFSDSSPQNGSQQPQSDRQAGTETWSAFGFEPDVFHAHQTIAQDGTAADLITALNSLFGASIHSTASLSTLDDSIATIRPIISRQAQLSSKAVLYNLFVTSNLESYLYLRFQYGLFGDAGFVDRIRRAMFGNTMGLSKQQTLHLNDLVNVKWPPMSSKLSLSLTGILDEPKTSFTIRQLSEADMEKACDAVSIHALDFLQLQIETPPALLKIFGKDSIRDYGRIFASILLDTRMLHLVIKLRQTGRNSNEVHRMYHVVSTLASHMMQLVIPTSWSDLMKVISSVSNTWEAGVQPETDLEAVQEAHARFLLQIRSRMFLRHSQSKVRSAVEAVYTQMLKSGKQIMESGAPSGCSRAVSTLVVSIEEHIRQLEKATEPDGGDIDMAKVLLFRLRGSS